MKRAIALGGGGARGSYEAGVWKALREEGIGFDIVTGTSIGAINGALMAQGDFDDAYRLWQTIRVNDVMADGLDLDFSVEGIEAAIRQPAKMGTFLKKYARNKGADITPLATLLREITDEPRLRSSGVEFGLVTVEFPKLVSFQLTLADIPEGQLCDYLLASAACFPAFPVYRIGSEGYIDGGYGDNLPIGLAFAMGAEHTVAVDLEYARATHPKYTNHPLVTYIRPTHPICSMLSFRPEAMAYNLRLGYLDTKKALGILQGFQYAFANIDSETAARAEVFVRILTGWDARLDRGIAGPRRSSKEGLLTDCVRRDTRGRRLSSLDYYLRATEICAALLGMDPLEIYIPEKITNLLARKITSQAGSKIAEILYLLEQGERTIDSLLHAAPLRPQEFCAALYLYVAHMPNGQEV